MILWYRRRRRCGWTDTFNLRMVESLLAVFTNFHGVLIEAEVTFQRDTEVFRGLLQTGVWTAWQWNPPRTSLLPCTQAYTKKSSKKIDFSSFMFAEQEMRDDWIYTCLPHLFDKLFHNLDHMFVELRERERETSASVLSCRPRLEKRYHWRKYRFPIAVKGNLKPEECQNHSYFHSFDGWFGDGDHLCPRNWGLGVHQWEQLQTDRGDNR